MNVSYACALASSSAAPLGSRRMYSIRRVQLRRYSSAFNSQNLASTSLDGGLLSLNCWRMYRSVSVNPFSYSCNLCLHRLWSSRRYALILVRFLSRREKVLGVVSRFGHLLHCV